MERRNGDAFEARVFAALETRLDSGLFGLATDQCTIVHRPKYYSRDRQSDIVFDLGIELRLEAGASPFLTIVVECKDYSSSIPASDLEEFNAKLDQCFGKNVKGMLISSGPLQESAVMYARARGFCVARLLPDDIVSITQYLIDGGSREEHVQWTRERHEDEVPEALTSPDFAMQSCEYGDFDFFAAIGDRNLVDLAEAITLLADPREANRWDFTEIAAVLADEAHTPNEQPPKHSIE